MSAYNKTFGLLFANFYGLLTYQVPKGGRLEDWQEHDEPSIHHGQAQVDVSLAGQDQVKKAITYYILGREEALEHFFRRTAINSP